MKTLQEQFILNHGSPVKVGSDEVIQMDRLPIHAAHVRVRLLGHVDGSGIALKSAQGSIRLSDGRKVRLLHIWSDPDLPSEVDHKVDCPDGVLRLWNIYRVQHPGGDITEEAWTGNAGMIVNKLEQNRRRYRCSVGPGDFDPVFEFEIAWEDLP